MIDATRPPITDPTPIFEFYRGSAGTELLTAAVSHFGVFERLARAPRRFEELRAELHLAERPAVVLVTALRAFGLLAPDAEGRLALTPQAREHLVPGSPFDISGYIGLSAKAPGVVEMVERLKTNRPAGTEPSQDGTASIYREGLESAMEKEQSARMLTLSLAGRAKNVAPVLAARYPLPDARVLLDVGGGTGLYAIAWLLRHPTLQAIVWDRPEVLKVATEIAAAHGVAERLKCVPGDMFTDPVPQADVILLSNVLHGWDVPQNRTLLRRCAEALPPGGSLLVHDVFLNDAFDGPLPVALYSAVLFSLTEGRAYSTAEYRSWLREAGLESGAVVPTLVHCGVLPARKPGQPSR